MFTIEVVLKMIALRSDFVFQFWNWVDSLIVLFWMLAEIFPIDFGVNPMMFRMCRLARLLRLIRLIKWVHFLGPLTLMVKSIRASLGVLVWTIALLVLIQSCIAMFLTQMLESYMLDVTKPLDKRQLVYSYFGTFTKAMLTTFEMALANWAPSCRVLVENVSEWFSLFFMLYKCSIGFAAVNVLMAVFLHETFKVAESDDTVLMMQKTKADQVCIDKMAQLFFEGDRSGDGLISWTEFERLMSDTRVRAYLSALNLDVGDLRDLFIVMDDGDGRVSFREFQDGIKKVRGAARSLDMVNLLHATRKIALAVNELSVRAGFIPPDASSPRQCITDAGTWPCTPTVA